MYGGKCEAEYFRSCLALQAAFISGGMSYDWLTLTNESLITRARNVVAKTFLEGPHDALLFIDGDIEFDAHDVAKLWNLGKPVAGGCYSRKRPGEVPKVWVGNVERPLSDFTEPLVCDRLATGFLMIRREALVTLKETAVAYDESGECWEFFNTPIDRGADAQWSDRYMLSEDYAFCEKWKAVGGELWTDPSIHLRHWGRMAF